MDRAVASKVDAQRAKTGYTGRIKQVGRLLWEPVGENRPAPRADEPEPEWLTPDRDETELLAKGRNLCPVCREVLLDELSDGSTQCPNCKPTQTEPIPTEVAEVTQTAAKDPTTPTRPNPAPHRKPRGVYDQDDTFTCGGCGEERNAAIGRETPDGLRCAFCQRYGSEAVRSMHHHDGALPQPSTPDRQQAGTTINNGGTAMSTDTIDLVDYNSAVAQHEQALEKLRGQLAEATAFEQHVTGILGAVEAMDANRGEVTNALAPLAEGMEGGRYGADATQGSAEATAALTAGSIAEVQEHIEAAADRNQRWKAELTGSIEGVQASLQHIKSQYGEAAATVQETGIDPNALAEH